MKPDHTDINITVADYVATIEIQRPPHNFIDQHLLSAIVDAYEGFDKDPGCRAIVLCSAGKNFCAGANYDPNESEEEATLSLDDFFQHAERLFRCQTPVIAAIQGAAVGGGLGLAVSADFRVTCPEGRFHANFTRLGFNPGFGLPVTLPRLIGAQRANLMFLTSRRIKGEQAYAWGLADDLVPLEQLRGAALALAGEIAANAPLATRATRLAIRRGLAEEIERYNAEDLSAQHRLRETADWQEGITAVAERRNPVFKGR